ncbi:MAG TPA: PEPxxWA-CTERM sorting domain-containing protein [Sphingomonadaceae bacterium]|nr:PEPxxWA-CTERM sorting domain-containing protein [Sphingomonadaceae bacterium]
MRKWMGTVIGAAMMLGAAPAMATTMTLDLTGNSSTSGSSGNTRTFHATVGGQTVNVQATAWTMSRDWFGNYSIQSAYLGDYDKGLGVTTNDGWWFGGGSDDHTNGHTIDNKDSYDFVVLQFDQLVQIDQATLTAFKIGSSTDLDISTGIGTTGVNWNSILGTSDISTLLGTRTDIDRNSSTSNGHTYTVDINPSDIQGNLLFVGASFDSSDRDDGFKLGGLTLSTVGAVPEPATWAMMIAGFGLVGAAMRRRPTIAHVAA